MQSKMTPRVPVYLFLGLILDCWYANLMSTANVPSMFLKHRPWLLPCKIEVIQIMKGKTQ